MSTQNPNQTLLQGAHQSPSDKTPAPLAPSSSLVSFEFQNVQPPSILYIDVDDQLVLSAASSQTGEVVTVNVRLLLPNGRIEDMQFQSRPGNTRAVLTNRFSLAQGYILSASAVTSVAVTRGQTFLRISIQRSASGSAQPAQMLFADYVTNLATSAYPNGPVRSPVEGPGLVYTATVANPGVGLDWTATVPTNARWRVRAFQAVLTTSATVANRQIASQIAGAAGTLWTGPAVVNATATSSFTVSAGGIQPYVGLLATAIQLPLPPDLIIAGTTPFNHNVRVGTSALQAGDQWSAINLLVEEWLDNV